MNDRQLTTPDGQIVDRDAFVAWVAEVDTIGDGLGVTVMRGRPA